MKGSVVHVGRFILVIFALAVLSGCIFHKSAGKVTEVDGEKMLLGEIAYQDILKNFPEWQEVDEAVAVKPEVVERLKRIQTPVEIQCFLGTWCSDSRHGVPPMVKALQAARNNNIHLTLYGVNRQKDDPKHLGPRYHIERVPTFILFRNGEEIARMVEHPLNETFAEDLLDILKVK